LISKLLLALLVVEGLALVTGELLTVYTSSTKTTTHIPETYMQSKQVYSLNSTPAV
jgi:hypothetical protein